MVTYSSYRPAESMLSTEAVLFPSVVYFMLVFPFICHPSVGILKKQFCACFQGLTEA